MSYQAHGPAMKEGKTCNNRGIIAKPAVAMDFGEVRTKEFDIVQEVRTSGIAREFDLFKG
jgi:hypothetical protein